MTKTFESLLVVVIALLPGATYVFAYERSVGAYGARFADRVVRFLAASMVFHTLLLVPEVHAYRSIVSKGNILLDINLWLLQLAAVGYLGVPIIAGMTVGYCYRRGIRWVRVLVGREVHPRAWDFVWQKDRNVLVRARLKSGAWVAGLFATSPTGETSYASGYPEEGDLFLSVRLKANVNTGELERNDKGQPLVMGHRRGLLMRWSEVEYLDVQPY